MDNDLAKEIAEAEARVAEATKDEAEPKKEVTPAAGEAASEDNALVLTVTRKDGTVLNRIGGVVHFLIVVADGEGEIGIRHTGMGPLLAAGMLENARAMLVTAPFLAALIPQRRREGIQVVRTVPPRPPIVRP